MSIDQDTIQALASTFAEAFKEACTQAGSASTSKDTMFQVKPPPAFNINEPVEWPKWIRQFELFRNASGLGEKSEAQQINMLVYSMGQDDDDLLNSLKMTDDLRTTYAEVKKKFSDYFTCTKNLFLERTKFINHVQKEGTNVDSFINDLHHLAARCDWSCDQCNHNFSDQMILLKLVTGLTDRNLSEQLQQSKEMPLKDVVNRIRQFENFQSEKNGEMPKNGLVEQTNVREHNQERIFKRKRDTGISKRKGFRCVHCGSTKIHPANKCWAKFVKCHSCKQWGHSKRACNIDNYAHEIHESGSESTRSVSSTSVGSNLHSIVVAENKTLGRCPEYDHSRGIFVTCSVEGTELKFKLDTGADVTCLGE